MGKGKFRVIAATASVLLWGAAAAQAEYKLPDSDQRKCYHVVDPYEIPCAGTGQDGEYVINPLSYTDHGNGTVTDNNTGLMWQKQDDGKTYTWSSAITACENLILGGHADWRLPNEQDLRTIVDYSIPSPGPTIHPVFTGTKSSDYWSSSTDASYPSDAWVVYFAYGFVHWVDGSGSGYVRCVHGGQ